MKIKIGDKVRFLNESGEGKVVRLLQNNLVEVRTPDGWDIPYPIQELIVLPTDEGGEAYKPETDVEKKDDSQKKSSGATNSQKDELTNDILFLVVQEKEERNFIGLKCFLVNDSNKNLDFIYYKVGNEDAKVEEKDLLEPGTKICLDELKLESLSSFKGWHIQGILSSPDQTDISPVVNRFIPFQTKKFASSGAYMENDFLHEPAMTISLIIEEKSIPPTVERSFSIDRIIDQKESGNIQLNTPNVFKTPNIEKPPREIDLHINQLIDNVIGMSNREIISIQLEAFQRELNLAITNKERSIVFIHGIGNGTLKKELHKSIERDYLICQYEDASFKEYGFGATLVKIRQNK